MVSANGASKGWGKNSQKKDLTSKKKMVTKENSKYACSLNKH